MPENSIIIAELEEMLNKLTLYKKSTDNISKCIFYQQAVDTIKMIKAFESQNLMEAFQ